MESVGVNHSRWQTSYDALKLGPITNNDSDKERDLEPRFMSVSVAKYTSLSKLMDKTQLNHHKAEKWLKWMIRSSRGAARRLCYGAAVDLETTLLSVRAPLFSYSARAHY